MQLTAYVTFMNVVTVVLYLLTLLLTLDFPSYQLRDLPQLTNSNVNNSELIYLQSVQKQTGLRQVSLCIVYNRAINRMGGFVEARKLKFLQVAFTEDCP